MKIGGRNKKKTKKNYHHSLVGDAIVRKKGRNKVWVKKEEYKENIPLSMHNQEKPQTWAKKKLECNSHVSTQPLMVWKKKENDMIMGSRSFISLQ